MLKRVWIGSFAKMGGLLHVWVLFAFCADFLEANIICGVSAIEPKFTRIVGGHVAVPGSWPWLVMLNKNGKLQCGGALISPHWVLTASHCFSDEITRNPSYVKAYIGKFHKTEHDVTEQKVGIKQIIKHPRYDTRTFENDVALVLFEHPVTYNSHVSPLCLPDNPHHQVRNGDVCVMAGWGETEGTSNGSVLNQVRLPLLDDNTCRRPDWYGREYYPATMMCAGYESGGHDSCHGDSGGPLMCQRNGTYLIAGVTSWGVDCAGYKEPGVYADVSVYINWLKAIMRNHGHPYE